MVSMGTVKTLLTFEEFEQLPDQPGKRELVRGELIEMPPAESKHNRRAHRIYEDVKAALQRAHARGEVPKNDRPGGLSHNARGEALELGEAFHEMGYLLQRQNWLQPDVSVTYAGQPEGKYFEGAPAIAIEVISPECGAREVWSFFPKTRQVTIQVPGSVRVIAEDGVITTPLLPGLAMAVKDIFGD